MYILFGTRKKIKPVKSLGINVCENCHHSAEQTLVKEKTSFTVFFIPVIGRTSARRVICPCCGDVKELNKKEFNEIKTA